MRNRACVITGATSGLGRAAAMALGKMGANLLLVGRNSKLGDRVAKRIRDYCTSSRVDFVRTDLSNMEEVRALARQVGRAYGQIDVLINNAGARFDVFGQTADGFESTFATNHLSHFLLTCLLLESLLGASSARVITVSSGSHAAASADGDWQLSAANYDRRMAYAKSKLANVLFARELAARLNATKVTSNAVDPGGVASRFALNNGLLSWVRHLVAHGLRRQLVLPRKGAETIVHLASAPELQGVSGRYFRQKRAIEPAPPARDPEAAKRLWELSLRLGRVNCEIGSIWPLIEP